MHHLANLVFSAGISSSFFLFLAEATATAASLDPTSYVTLGGAAVSVCGVLWVYLERERKALIASKDAHIEALRAREKIATERADRAETKLLEVYQKIASDHQE